MRAKLFCKTGELSGTGGQIGNETTIGRGAENTLVLGAAVVSQAHARIFYDTESGGYILEDLASKNGTQLDGIRVHGRERLRDLHIVTFGEQHDFVFVVSPEPPSVPVEDAPSETIYDEASVLQMPVLTDAPAPKNVGEQPDGDQTMHEAPSALHVPSLDEPAESSAAATGSGPDTVYAPPSALELPSFEPRAPTLDPDASSESETVFELPSTLEMPPLEAGNRGVTDPPATSAARVVLEVTAADGGRSRVELGDGRHDIGRARDCAVWIDDRTLTRRHAVLTVAGDVVTIADPGSRNGTFKDDARLTGPVTLRVGEVVTLGDQVTVRLLAPSDTGAV